MASDIETYVHQVSTDIACFELSLQRCICRCPRPISACEEGMLCSPLLHRQLINPITRENALLELSKKRENFPELAPYLWYSFGTVAALLQVRSSPSCRNCIFLAVPIAHIMFHADLVASYILRAGNCDYLPTTVPAGTHCPCLEPCLQCTGSSAMRCIPPRHSWTFPAR